MFSPRSKGEGPANGKYQNSSLTDQSPKADENIVEGPIQKGKDDADFGLPPVEPLELLTSEGSLRYLNRPRSNGIASEKKFLNSHRFPESVLWLEGFNLVLIFKKQ